MGDTQIVRHDERFAWSQEQLELIKRQCAKGATDDEFQMFLHFCQESGVDPLRKQAHFVVNEYKDRNGQMQRSTQMIVGIDGFRKRAEEQTDFLGIQSAAVYKNDVIEIDFGKGEVIHKVNPIGRKKEDVAGAWAIVHRVNRSPYVEWIDWAEYVQGYSPMHKQKPAVMAKKTVEATALRHEYPDKFSGMYAPEEMPKQYQVPELMADDDDRTPMQSEGDQPQGPPQDQPYTAESVIKTVMAPTPPQPDDDPGIDFSGSDGPPPDDAPPPEPPKQEQERNVPQEIRIAYGRIVGGIQTALDLKFTKEMANDLLVRIMTSLEIPVPNYIGEDGFVHTKPMQLSAEGHRHASKLINALDSPGALATYKEFAKDLIDTEPEPQPGDSFVKPTPNIEDLRKAVVDIQSRIGQEYGADGIKLAVNALQKCGLHKGGEMTVENLSAANAEMVAIYTKLCADVPAKELL